MSQVQGLEEILKIFFKVLLQHVPGARVLSILENVKVVQPSTMNHLPKNVVVWTIFFGLEGCCCGHDIRKWKT